MKRKSIAPGVYIDEQGVFWARPEICHRRTWRKLKAIGKKAAIAEAHSTEWKPPVERFEELAAMYLDNACPSPRLEPRTPALQLSERTHLRSLLEYFGRYQSSEIRLHDLPRYKAWRVQRVSRANTSGHRTVDKELCTLSNVLNYGVALGAIDFNPIRSGRPRFCLEASVRHCREFAPVDGDELNRLANYLFDFPRSEALAWQFLLEAMTGCRTNEIIALRLDAANPDTPGFVKNNWLFLKRSKKGVNPYALIHSDLREVLDAHRRWHAERVPLSPWYIPGMDGVTAMHLTSLNHALARATKALGLPHRTSHGLRSFYVTKRRSDGVSDAQIAGEIGDKTVELIHRTYGDRPANWLGGSEVSWRPSSGQPSWHRWLGQSLSVVQASEVHTKSEPASYEPPSAPISEAPEAAALG